MKYILNDSAALRSWTDIPYGANIRSIGSAIRLNRKEFGILLRCDGEHEFEETEINGPDFQKLSGRKLIAQAKPGEKLREWQRPKRIAHPFLGTVNLRITGRCNFNCRHCFNAADENRDLSEWTMPELCRLFDEAAEYDVGCFELTGGEPMLHPNLLQAIEEIHKRNMHVKAILTNAHYIAPNFLRGLKEIGVDPLFRISFDCIGHHDWMRRQEGAEKQVLKNIRLCTENGYHILLNVQLNKVTRDTLLKTAEYFDTAGGVDVFRIIRTTETPRWARLAGDACLSFKEYFDECVEFLRSYAKKQRKMKIICWEFAKYSPCQNSYSAYAIRCSAKDFRPHMPCCITRMTEAAIGSDGALYPDHEASGYYDSIGMSFGNVKRDGLAKSLANSDYRRIARMTAGDLAEKGSKCRACTHFLQCQGGCRAMAEGINEEKNEYASDPAMCTFFDGDYLTKLKQALPDCNLEVPLEEHCEWTKEQDILSTAYYLSSACNENTEH